MGPLVAHVSVVYFTVYRVLGLTIGAVWGLLVVKLLGEADLLHYPFTHPLAWIGKMLNYPLLVSLFPGTDIYIRMSFLTEGKSGLMKDRGVILLVDYAVTFCESVIIIGRPMHEVRRCL